MLTPSSYNFVNLNSCTINNFWHMFIIYSSPSITHVYIHKHISPSWPAKKLFCKIIQYWDPLCTWVAINKNVKSQLQQQQKKR